MWGDNLLWLWSAFPWWSIILSTFSFVCCSICILSLENVHSSPLSIVYSWYSCPRSVDHIWVGLFLSSLFCFIGLSICLYSSMILFIYCSVVMYFEVRKCGCHKLYSLCSDTFGYSRFCGYIQILRVFYLFLLKKCLCTFDVDSTEFVDCFG